MAEKSKLHIVMFPWLAFGDMIPFLELAKIIAKNGHSISFVSTPRNVDRLPKISLQLSSFITFVKLPLPNVTGNLPENAEATFDVPYEKVKFLKIAYDGLQESLENFLQEAKPDWIFFDFAAYWLVPIASKLNIPTSFFSIFPAALLSFMGSAESLVNNSDYRKEPQDFTVPPTWVTFKSNVAFKLFEIMRIFDDAVKGDDDNVSDLYRFGASILGCDFVGIRSSYEFEPEWLQSLKELNGKEVIPVGLLPPAVENDGDDVSWIELRGWLDKQVKASVVYIAFGSEAIPSQDELTELAFGLELSNLPFLWVFKNQRGDADSEVIELPDGFEERTKDRGMVWTSWAPQVKILSHDSVGGFLTHSGWSSVVEGLHFEKPFIILTFLVDQGINARVLEEKKLGYSIPRNDQDGSFTRNSVAESLKQVMVADEGQVYRNNVKEMKIKIFGDKTKEEEYINNLLSYLEANKKIKEPEVK